MRKIDTTTHTTAVKGSSVTVSTVTTTKPIRAAKHTSLKEIRSMTSGKKSKHKLFKSWVN
ncbi:hypothetical protein [Exiguobacterium acetylicum]|uniref:hypothetical protein n=1 Tax=Exiguobacterium acetylicum TaxID=41170 RepID=UPI0034D76744